MGARRLRFLSIRSQRQTRRHSQSRRCDRGPTHALVSAHAPVRQCHAQSQCSCTEPVPMHQSANAHAPAEPVLMTVCPWIFAERRPIVCSLTEPRCHTQVDRSSNHMAQRCDHIIATDAAETHCRKSCAIMLTLSDTYRRPPGPSATPLGWRSVPPTKLAGAGAPGAGLGSFSSPG